MPPNITRKPAVIVVHLGNLGFARERPNKTRKYAKRFPNAEFVGIDVKRPEASHKAKNWRQLEANFEEGLRQLKNNSVSIISSEMALGYYGREAWRIGTDEVQEHTANSLRVAYRKLKKGGKLMLAAHKARASKIIAAFLETPFELSKITVRPFTEKEYERTHWTRKGKRLVQITAVK